MKAFDKPIFVTRPNLPSRADFAAGLEEIWSNRWLTNRGPVARRFEGRIAAFLGADHLRLFTTGALALEIALQGLHLQGEVITSPFSFVATSNAILRCGLTPVFADISLDDLNIDPDHVEALITPRTSAILAVHIFGRPCQLHRLAAIAARHGLALIYDAAHAFGVTVAGQPISRFGDISMFSFHATKFFHTIEGGALTYGNPALTPVFDALCNHGLEPDGDVLDAGTNAKMSEFQALMGELMMDKVAPAIAHAATLEATYRARLAEIPGLQFMSPCPDEISANHSFMPILVDEHAFGMTSDALKAAMLRHNVHVRRYFTPLISDMQAFRRFAAAPLPRAQRIGPQVMALPIYADLAVADVHRICDIITGVQQTGTSRAC